MAAKKRVVRKQTGDVAAEEIRRLWGNIPVVDAKKDLRVFMSQEDIRGAKRKDPAGCVFARACRRVFHSTKVLFFRTVAYIDLPDKDGSRHVERFLMDGDMRDLVTSFDRGNGVIPQAGFVLKAPTPSMQLDRKRKRNRSYTRDRHRRELLGEVVITPAHQKAPFQDEPIIVDLEVRSGMGAVHFGKKNHPEPRTP